MELYGSDTSPFVRRLRIYLDGRDYKYIKLNIFEKNDRELLTSMTPIKKIPLLKDGEKIIDDSSLIYRYLRDKAGEDKFNLEDERIMKIIDSCNDSLLSLLFLKRSEVNVDEDKPFFNIQRERAKEILSLLNQYAGVGKFSNFDYKSISLYCLIDWIEFREMFDLSSYGELLKFKDQLNDRDIIKLTDPRI